MFGIIKFELETKGDYTYTTPTNKKLAYTFDMSVVKYKKNDYKDVDVDVDVEEAEEQVEEKKVEDDDKNNTIFMPLDVKLQKKTYYTHDDYSRIFKSLPELQKMLTDMPKNAFLIKNALRTERL